MATGVPFSNTPIFSKVPPFLRSAPFGELRLSRLHALLDSLGGILWLPNQHNYTLTADTAVAPSGDPVGYIGSHRQNLPENWIKDTRFTGGVAGAPGTMPTGWVKAATSSGLTTEIVEAGSGYLVIRVYGTATATGIVNLVANTASSSYMAPAKASQLWSAGMRVEYVAGTWNTNKVRFALNEYSGSAFLANTVVFINSTGNAIATRTLTDSTCAYVYIGAAYSAVSGEVVDLTIKLSEPQVERGKPTAFTPTYGEAITRGVNFEPAWQDTTANKPILGVDADGKSILTFDGSNDFFRTGIQTPEAGYIAGVWTLGATGGTRAMFSSNNGTFTGVRLFKTTLDLAQVQRHDGVLAAAGAIVALAMPLAKTVVDGHFATASASVRTNGQNEGTNTASRVTTSANYFRIGADGNTNGGDTQANYWPGSMLAQVWIPGARPGATIEAEIRRLLAEITAVSGVV